MNESVLRQEPMSEKVVAAKTEYSAQPVEQVGGRTWWRWRPFSMSRAGEGVAQRDCHRRTDRRTGQPRQGAQRA